MRKRRALATNSTRWRELREGVLRRNPLCVHCAQRGLTRAAVDVDHIDGNPMNNLSTNLQGLCRECHSRKTARENFGFGRDPSKTRVVGCDADGNPLDPKSHWK